MKKIILFLLITFFYIPAQATVVNGRDWADFGSFVNVTYNTVDTIFDKNTGECRTSSCAINGIDLTGFQWATSSDIFDLITNYGVTGPFNPNVTATFNAASSSFFTDFTLTGSSPDRIATMSRDSNINTVDYFNINTIETYFGNGGARTFTSYDGIGHAFYREVSTVPIPAAFWLFGSALLGLFGITKRRRAED